MNRNSYIVFSYSNDEQLFRFCEFMCSSDKCRKNSLNSVLKSYKVNNNPLSIVVFLKTIDFMKDFINLRFICELILKHRKRIQKKIEYTELGCIVSENFVKYNMSLEHRMTVLKEYIKEML